ncbi:uncharacterized protein KY384_002338 [Bacidia gigantensis]|uniref:uncharacterized protein n=1 Tax=Bacidia gigantensis TaxID=2732470 RepID=UPI001D05ADBD|nr:uncharacterized protein KY384_002338 [Bacidia gigantensis]KAG8532461.1 hypothetical protein KY384_002338 [Bacidia gigantensis]
MTVPLESLPNRPDLIPSPAAGILHGFLSLDFEQQATYLSLHIGDNTARDMDTIKALVELGDSVFPDLAPEVKIGVLRIFDTNAFAQGNTSGIFPKASKINHSCLPNAHCCWNDRVGLFTVSAVRNIAAGEEIEICYKAMCRTREERAEDLSVQNFICGCKACDATTTFGRKSDERRKQLAEIEQALSMYLNVPAQILDVVPGFDKRELLRVLNVMEELLKAEGINDIYRFDP